MINSGNNAASSPAATASSSSSLPPATSGKTPSNTNLTDCSISIDTTHFVVDIPQQDSGSNQSGSDSGLSGYTNSISSDNSSFNNATATTTSITGQVVVESTTKGNNNNIPCVSNSNTSNKNNNESSKNNYDESFASNNKHFSGSSSLASSCTKILPANQHHHHHQHSNKDEVSGEFVDLAHDFYKIGSLDKQTTLFKSKDNPVSDSETSQKPPQKAPLFIHPTFHQSANAPVLKSLLKKPSTHLTSDNAPNKQKPNRSVSFNQTVIVFCEEFGAPSPDGDQFEPPLGYEDAIVTTYEPPDDYCDRKIDERKSVVIDEPSLANATTGPDNTDGFDHRRAFCSGAASNLTDDQLIGLLENDTLLETFKLNCDELSEDDFPINHLNSNHSYLCNDAISDYDSDSESSFCSGRKEAPNCIVAELSPVSAQNNPPASSSFETNRYRSASGSESDILASRSPNERSSTNESINLNTQRSMPARMKVSTVVDNSHSKRQFSRQDDQVDLKFKLESCQSNPQKGYEHRPQPQSASLPSAQSEVNALSAPLLIKQTNLEPVALSKTIIVANQELTQNSNKNLTNKSKMTSQNSSISKTSDHIEDEQISQVSSGPKIDNHIGIGSQSPAVGVNSNARSCQICKVIESNKAKNAPELRTVQVRGDSSLSDLQPASNTQRNDDLVNSNPNQFNNKVITSQPAVINQSCISCREASLQQQNIAQNGSQPPSINRPPIRPVTYQLVYVVDSKGNRIRALSMVRAGVPRNPNPNGSIPTDRRVFIAQNGVRFPNPVSVAGQIVNIQQNNPQQSQPHPQWNRNPVSAPQYQVFSSIQAQNYQTQQNHSIQYPVSNLRPSNYVSNLQRVVPIGKPRPHTVYYVRQPLVTQNLNQSFDLNGSASRSSFPNPHEIRRLDGLRGPTAGINLSDQINNVGQAKIPDLSSIEDNRYQRQVEDSCKQVSSSMGDDMDDPTFGFSKRPSVKVVATNSNLSSFNTSKSRPRVDGRNQGASMNAHPNNLVAIQHLPSQAVENVRPVSLVVMRSHTLDRNQLTQQSQQQSMKENMPSTSSMSNIHGSFNNLPSNKKSMNSTTQQPRISGIQLTNPTQDNLKTSKETKPSDLNDIRAENKKNVILSNKNVPQADHVSATDRNHRKLQGQSDVIYSMNI